LATAAHRRCRPFKKEKCEEQNMRGWMILFALMTVAAAGMSITDTPSVASMGASFLFGVLFLLSLLAQAMRGRAE
jgi:hypothetical protein